MQENTLLFFSQNPVLIISLAAGIATVMGLVLYQIGAPVLLRGLSQMPYAQIMIRKSAIPLRLLLIIIVFQSILVAIPDSVPVVAVVRQAMVLLLVGAITCLSINILQGIGQRILQAYPEQTEDNLVARRVRTKMTVLVRILSALLVLLGVSIALLTFPAVREIGASLLASAGLAGLVIGFAAKSVLSNMIAGLYIAIAQPLRIDDVVVIEGECGKIEEIAGAYIVVKVWDERRLIVPLQWLIDRPFQNWTRNSLSITGTVFLWVDYRLPLEPLRTELQRICRAAPEWDQRVSRLQVTDVSDRAMQIRALVSSASSSKNWDLRCRVREGLIQFLQRQHPDSLPHIRTEVMRMDSPSTRTSVLESDLSHY